MPKLSARRIKLEADKLDQRRQAQIANQISTIDRLLEGATYEGELATLHEQLADTQVRLMMAEHQLRVLRGEVPG